ncbi:MAG: site-specific integrase [Chloroflexi bacterium]|nr:MAG: site-specific integrase [Chloroflexota bacterium]
MAKTLSVTTRRRKPAEAGDTPIAKAIEDFESYLRVTRSLPAYNVRNYFHYPLMAIVPPFCEERGIDVMKGLDREAVDQLVLFIEGLRSKRNGAPISPASRVAYLKAVKYFLRWAQGEKMTPVDGDHIGLPALKKQHKDVLTKDEQRRLEAGAQSERDKLIIKVMLETAAREEGVANIQTTDLVERDRRFYFVRVTDKTGTRQPPITPELYRRLVDYRAGKTGRARTRSSFLFIATHRDRTTKQHEPLGTAGVYRAIKKAAEVAELDRERVKPHLLRATAITRMCNAGMHPAMVSEITGVSVAVIARHYHHPAPEDVWQAAMLALDE